MNSIEIMCMGSGSRGNAYAFKKNDEVVLVELGFEPKELLNKLINNNIDITKVVSCIVTHAHKDHSASLSYMASNGIQCYAPFDTIEKLQLYGDSIRSIVDEKPIRLAKWLVAYPFAVKHDIESYGFVFYDTETEETTLFINDTRCFDFKWKKGKYDYIFIECNHIRNQLEAIMDKALLDGKEGSVFKYKRQATYHMSLAACKKFLSAMDLSKTKTIVLMHLSKECCKDTVVKYEIEGKFGIRTYVAGTYGGIN